MNPVMMDIPEDSVLALKVSPEKVGPVLRMAAAVKLYEMGRLSSGAAANLAGVPRVVFLSRLSEFEVDTFSITETQLQREVRFD